MRSDENRTDAGKPAMLALITRKESLVELRQNFRLLLLENSNYFGNLTEAGVVLEGFEPVVKMVSNTHYEELICVSFNSDIEELRSVVRIKQISGYAGGPCTDGSKEYVRFYLFKGTYPLI